MKENSSRKAFQMLQSDPQDNAQTVLAMVLTSLGTQVRPWELPVMESAADLVRQARLRGFYAEGCRMTVQELRGASLPAIVHWRYRSFAVVSRIRRGRVWLYDPEEGLLVLSLKDFAQGFTGVTVCVAPQGEVPPAPAAPRARAVLGQFPGTAAALITLEAFLCVCCAASVCGARLLAEDGGSWGVWIFCAATVLQLGTALAQALLLKKQEARLRRRASEECTRRLERKSQLFFRQVQLHQVSCVCHSCGWVGNAQTELALQTVRLAGPAVCLILLAVQDPWAGLAALPGALVWLAAVQAQEERIRNGQLLAERERYRLCHQTAREMEQTEPLRGENRGRFETWLAQAGGRPETAWEESVRWSWYILFGAVLAPELAVCLIQIVRGRMDLTMLAGCLSAALYFLGTLRAFPRRIAARAALETVRETWSQLFDVESAPEAAERLGEDGAETLTLHNVHLAPSYPEDPGLQGVSFFVRRGEVLSVTTDGDPWALSRLLSGIVRPTQGEVSLGNTDLCALREEELYRSVTQLGRGLPLPRGTVRENITAGRESIPDQAVAAAAGSALLHGSILLRKEGYDVLAANLSEGERVLLEFACAFAREAPFLVVDECIRKLDQETQRRLLEAARQRGAGVVLVGRDGETVRWADAVCRIREGRVTLLERSEIVSWEGEGFAQSGT